MIDPTPASDESVFAAALDLPDATARAKHLDAACADPAQRARVADLLLAHDAAGGFLGTGVHPAVGAADGDTLTFGGAGIDPMGDARGYLSPSPRAGAVGRIGHYDVLEVLGRGGFGTVFRAFDDVLQRVVAVKVLSPHLAATSPARKRFLREARSSAAVRHEHVVQVYAVEEAPLPYLVMEFIPGGTLQERLNRTGPLDAAEVVRLGRQIADGLAAAHARGLVHRDVKPANVLIEAGSPGRAKLTDFGLARAADDASISQSGVVAGTPLYMAPEQARGDALDHRADLFSLGSVLYALLTGRPPFRAESTVAVLKRVAEDTPRPIREVIPETPDWLCRVVEKLHAKDPAGRYQSAREVADLLADCERQMASPAGVTAVAPRPAAPPTPRKRRPRWVLAVAAVGLLAAVGLGAWFGPPAALAVRDRGELDILPDEGLNDVIVLRNDTGVMDGRSLPAATDWMPMKERHTLTLPPGRYQLNVGHITGGGKLHGWDATSSGPLGGDHLTVPVADGSAVVTVERGRRTTLRAKVSVPAVVPPTAPVPPPAADGGWVQLFNGKDLTGWRAPPNEEPRWKVEGGALVGVGADDAYLYTARSDFRDFHLRVEALAEDGADGGVFVRTNMGHPAGAEEVNILGRADERANTGSLPGEVGGDVGRQLAPAGEWFTLEVVARGKRIVTTVNGKPAADSLDPERTVRVGHLALQYAGGLRVRFRKVEVKDLSAAVGQPVDLLARIDPAHDKLRGTWAKDGAALVSPPPFAQLAVPFTPPDHYLLRADVERTGGTGSFDLGLVVGGRTACVSVDYAGVRSGIGGMDGKLLRDSEAIHEGAVLQKGLNAVVAEVRGRRVTLRVNDSTVFDWEGDPSRLTKLPLWANTDGEQLYLGHQNAGYRITRLELVPLPPPSAPFAEHVAALPADCRAGAVESELRRKNPGWKGEVTSAVEDGKVLVLNLEHVSGVTDLGPVAGLKDLAVLHLPAGTYALEPLRGMRLRHLSHPGADPPADLSALKDMPLETLTMWMWQGASIAPLKGMPLKVLNVGVIGRPGGHVETDVLRDMPLERVYLMGTDVTELSALAGKRLTQLSVADTAVADLSVCEGMPLDGLSCQGSGVTDLSPLKGAPLKMLCAQNTKVETLAPLKGAPLEEVHCEGTKITDLSPLADSPLKTLTCDFDFDRDAKVLRGITTLETINGKPAADVLKAK